LPVQAWDVAAVHRNFVLIDSRSFAIGAHLIHLKNNRAKTDSLGEFRALGVKCVRGRCKRRRGSVRGLLFVVLFGCLVTAEATAVRAEAPAELSPVNEAAPQKVSEPAALSSRDFQTQMKQQRERIDALINVVESLTVQLQRVLPAKAPGDASAKDAKTLESPELRQKRAVLAELREEEQEAQAAQTPEQTQKQLELQRKEIDVLNKMVKLLADQLQKQGPIVSKLQTDVAGLDGRSLQGAGRDQQLGYGLDNLNEHVDSVQRYWSMIPATLKELADPSYNNETPLSIYGQVVERYHQFNGRSGVFESPAISPFFLLTLNQNIFLEANVDLFNTGLDVPFAQMDFILNDKMTAVVGRYLVPIGFYNERLNFEWGNKMYDSPLMFRQVSPLTSTDGVQLRGSSYIFGSPVKMEYSLYGGNGMQLAGPPSTVADLADLSVLANSDQVHAKAMGGRVGIWLPKWGFNSGVSGYYDHDYSLSAPNLNIGIVSVDASYHRGNVDARFEGSAMNQQAAAVIGQNIKRAGLYAQLAYRRYDLPNGFFQKLEFVARYSLERFQGIDPSQLDFTSFQNSTYVPVDRNQYAFSVNYYFYPSGIVKFGYEINQELHGINLNDNEFFTQVVWAF
jgi:hypothetical protein